MKKIFIFACAFAALLASSCENKEILTENAPERVQTQGVLMTLNVNLGAPDAQNAPARSAYEEEGNVLKATWSAGDSIAVISFNANSQTATVRSIDKFALTSGSGTSEGVFEGYFTGSDAERIVCYYPPISPTQIDPDTGMEDWTGYYGSAHLNGTAGTAYSM